MFKRTKALKLAEWDAMQAAERKMNESYEVIARLERAAASRVWDDPRHWR